MLASISSFANKVYSGMPAIKLDSPKNILRKTTLIALPAIALYGAAAAQGANAMMSCIVCVACLAAANPGCVLPCVICGVLLPIPVHVMEPGNLADQCQAKC